MEDHKNKPPEQPKADPKAEHKASRKRANEAVKVISRDKPTDVSAEKRHGPDKAILLHKTCGTTFEITGPGKAALMANQCPECGRVEEPGSLLRLGTVFADGSRAMRSDLDVNAEIERGLRARQLAAVPPPEKKN